MSTANPEITEAHIRALIKRMPKRDLIELAKMTEAVERRAGSNAPQTDDELHAWIVREIGVDIPRTAVCETHDAPFKFVADIFFDRVDSVLLMANRGGSKTYEMALVHYLNATFKPGIEGFSFGATEAQGRRCYAHLQSFVRITKDEEVASSLESKTLWKNGASLEIVPGSVKAVNGPHPVVVHADEVELMDQNVFDESRNMAQSKTFRDRVYKAKDIITSSRKFASGAMQRLIDEIHETVRKGRRPAYTLMQWCIFECAEEVKNCQVAYPDLCDHCDCDEIIKGRWDDDTDRSLKDVCAGKLARSRGWVVRDDIVKLFQQNSREMWEAQQECSRPSTIGLVVPRFRRERNLIRKFPLDPLNGQVFQGIDFGGTNPHAVLWAQRLDVAVDVPGYVEGTTTRVPEGSLVFFDELYEADISNSKLADRIVRRESLWRQSVQGFRVAGRHPDPQGKAARLELRNHKPPLNTTWLATRDVKEHLKLVNDLVSDNHFFIDSERCPMMVEEIEEWHFPRPRPGITDDPEIPVNDFDHCMAAMRYLIVNVARSDMRGGTRKAAGAASPQIHTTADFVKEARRSLATASRPRNNGLFAAGTTTRYGP